MSSTISAGTTSGTAIAISGDTSGQLVLQTNGTTTAVTISTGQVVTLAQPLPVASGGSGVTTSTGTGAVVLGTSPTLATPVLSGSVTGTYTLAGTPTMGASVITSGTTVATTSGTSIDFTGIPSWVKRITMIFNGVSTSGTSLAMIQLGDAGGIETTDYVVTSTMLFSQVYPGNYTTGFVMKSDSVSGTVMGGYMTLNLMTSSTFTWSGGGVFAVPNPTAYQCITAGTKSLSATLDRVRLTTVGGSDTFDLGSVNILYE